MEKNEYNGYTNWETYMVALWVDSDGFKDSLYNDAKYALRSGKDGEKVTTDIMRALEYWIEENNPLADACSMFADLLNGELREVDLPQIAQGIVEQAADDLKEESEAK